MIKKQVHDNRSPQIDSKPTDRHRSLMLDVNWLGSIENIYWWTNVDMNEVNDENITFQQL